MIKKSLIFILLTSLSTAQFSCLHAMEQPQPYRDIDGRLDDCFDQWLQILVMGSQTIFQGACQLVGSCWHNRSKIIWTLATIFVIERFTTAQASKAICSEEAYLNAIKELVSSYYSSIEKGEMCTDEALEKNPVFCAISYGSECQQTNKIYLSPLSAQYNLLYQGIRRCIDTYYHDQKECLNHLSEEILNLVIKKNT